MNSVNKSLIDLDQYLSSKIFCSLKHIHLIALNGMQTDNVPKEKYCSWFQAFAVFLMLYSFVWAILRLVISEAGELPRKKEYNEKYFVWTFLEFAPFSFQ
jgi:hypothetical protein